MVPTRTTRPEPSTPAPRVGHGSEGGSSMSAPAQPFPRGEQTSHFGMSAARQLAHLAADFVAIALCVVMVGLALI